MTDVGASGGGPTARLARRGELVAVDALLGPHDWTGSGNVGLLLVEADRLLGAAALTAYQTARFCADFRLRHRLVDGLPNQTAAAAFDSLLAFAIDASARAGVGALLVEGVPESSAFGVRAAARGLWPSNGAVYFEGDLQTAHAAARQIADRIRASAPSIAVVPLAACPPADVFLLSALSIRAVGLGVRSLFAGDVSAFESFGASYAVLVEERLRGAIVATCDGVQAFVELLAIEPRFMNRGLETLLIERCAQALLGAGVLTYTFVANERNGPMLRLAERLHCRCTRRSEVWKITFRSDA